MSKSVTLCAIMLMGGKEEPFLGACLESLADAVDFVVINDNSGLLQHPNRMTVESSRLFQSGCIQLVESEFIGFGPCRDLCMDWIRREKIDPAWIIFVDCDEVHTRSLITITKEILPVLPQNIGIVDGYFWQCYQDAQFVLSLDHRHNLMFRYHPEIRWTGQVHEHVNHLRGHRLVLPYCYFHYGYLKSPQDIVEKSKMYKMLGDASQPDENAVVEIVAAMAQKVTLFQGRHPDITKAPLDAVASQNHDRARFITQVESRFLLQAETMIYRSRISVKMAWLFTLCVIKIGWISTAFFQSLVSVMQMSIGRRSE